MPTPEYFQRKKAYITKYQKKNYRSTNFKCRIREDADIIEKLDSVKDKSNYIKGLIRNDINKNGL